MSNTMTDKLQRVLNHDAPIELKRLTNTKYRVGFCSRCGSCCREINIDSMASDNVLVWLNGYGIKTVIKAPMFTSPEDPRTETHSISMSIPIICTHLSQDENGVCSCDRHDDLPIICRAYPKSRSKHVECTYLFFNVEQLEVFFTKLKEWEIANGKTKEIINL